MTALMKTIVLTASAAKTFDSLPESIQVQINDGLILYAMTGRGDIKALRGQPGSRPRLGHYRVLFGEDGKTILAFYIGKRESTTYR